MPKKSVAKPVAKKLPKAVVPDNALTKRIAQLEATVAQLELEAQIERTYTRYSHAVDYGPAELLDDVFTEDGEFDILSVGGEPRLEFVRKVGRAAVEEYFAWQIEYNFLRGRYKHLSFAPKIMSVKGNVAKVETYFSAWREENAKPYLLCYGKYRDTLIKQRDGRWLIRERNSWMESPPSALRSPGHPGIERVPPGFAWKHS